MAGTALEPLVDLSAKSLHAPLLQAPLLPKRGGLVFEFRHRVRPFGPQGRQFGPKTFAGDGGGRAQPRPPTCLRLDRPFRLTDDLLKGPDGCLITKKRRALGQPAHAEHVVEGADLSAFGGDVGLEVGQAVFGVGQLNLEVPKSSAHCHQGRRFAFHPALRVVRRGHHRTPRPAGPDPADDDGGQAGQQKGRPDPCDLPPRVCQRRLLPQSPAQMAGEWTGAAGGNRSHIDTIGGRGRPG